MKVLMCVIFTFLCFSSVDINSISHELVFQNNENEKLSLKATIYHPIESQCDSDPHITACGYKIDLSNPEKHRYVALSRDLIRPFYKKHKMNGYNDNAPFQFGDTIKVENAGDLSGIWTVGDEKY